MAASPLAKGQQNRLEAQAQPGCCVVHAGRHLTENFPMHQPVFHHFAQLLDQYFLAGAGHESIQFG